MPTATDREMSISSSCSRGTVGRRAFVEPQAAQPQASAAEQKAQERAPRRGRQGEPHPVEDRAEGQEALVNVPAHQELVGRAALQIDQLELVGAGRRLLVRTRRLDAPAYVRQGIAQPRAGAPCRRGINGPQLERVPVELDRPIKREGLARLIRRKCIVMAGLGRVLRPPRSGRPTFRGPHLQPAPARRPTVHSGHAAAPGSSG